jgi:hypothetical protein
MRCLISILLLVCVIILTACDDSAWKWLDFTKCVGCV